MKRNAESPDGRTNRRTFLGFLGVAATAHALPVARTSTGDTGAQFTLRQGDRCIPVTTLSHQNQSVEEFYGYSTEDYESHTATSLETSDVSQLFLYEGPDGRVSLAIIHDVAEGSEGTGGAASFEFEGLAPDGEWLVRNDDYEGADDVWDTSEDHADDAVHWTWNRWHSDGGVFGGLGAEFEVTVMPAFNEAARLDPGTPGEITDWQFVTGDAADPERVSLALDEPLTLTTDDCSGAVETRAEADLVVNPDEDGVVNPKSRGRLPVAVLSSASFDATTIDPETVRFGPAEARAVHAVHADVDGDGRTDLFLHFWMDDTGITMNTTGVTLSGETADGRTVTASAAVDVPENRDDEAERREHEDDHEETEREKDERRRERAQEKRERNRENGERKREKEERKGRGRGHDERNGRGRGKGRGRGHDDDDRDEDDDEDDWDNEDDDDDDDDSHIGIEISVDR